MDQEWFESGLGAKEPKSLEPCGFVYYLAGFLDPSGLN